MFNTTSAVRGRWHARRRLAGLAALLVLCSGCNSERQESNECLETRKVALEAAVSGTLLDAENLLQKTKQLCGKPSAYHIERLERALERKKKHAAELKASEDDNAPMRDFIAFARHFREASDKGSSKAQCASRTDPRFGLCRAQQTGPQGARYQVDYFRDDPQIFRFQVKLDTSARCLDFGEHRDLATWTREGVTYERCDLSSPGLVGLRGLIQRTPEEATVSLFTANYPKVDEEFGAKLAP